MNNKKIIKTVIIVLVLILTGIAAVVGIKTVKNYLGGAAGGEAPKGVRFQVTATSATISWQTDKEVMGTVEYGANPSNLILRVPETQPTTVHRVTLAPLKPNTTYYFRIRVGETLYDNNGIAWSFRTKAETTAGGESLSPTPTGGASLTVSPSPATGGTLVKTCVQSEFEAKMGTQDPAYDFDKNGVVNTRDWLECLRVNY